MNLSPEDLQGNADRLNEIREEIEDLLGEAEDITHSVGGLIQSRAESYWLAHIRIALSENHRYLGGSICSMESTAREIEECIGEENE